MTASVETTDTADGTRPTGRVDGSDWVRYTVLYLVIAGLVIFPGLGTTGVTGIEGMIADTAESMIASGEPIVTRLYGEVHTYKPPFTYWVTAASFRAFGNSELSLRLPTALSTLAMGLAVLALVGCATRPRVGCYAALATTTSGLFLQEVKQGEFDAILAAAVGIAVAAACHNLTVDSPRRSPWVWLLCYLALSAGFLTKGMPALMAFAPGLAVGALVTGRLGRLFRWDHLLCAGLFLAVGVGYVWALWELIGPAAFDQPLEEAGRRGFRWSPEALGQTLSKPITIWAVFLPWSLVWPWSRTRPTERPDRAGGRRPIDLLTLASWSFLGAGILTFMAVPTHHTRYYLPLAAPAGLVAGCALEWLASRPTRLASRLALGLAALVAVLSVALGFLAEIESISRFVPVVVGLAALVVVALIGRVPRSRRLVVALLATVACFWAAETWVLRPQRAMLRDMSPVSREFAAHIPPGETVWTLGPAEPVGEWSSVYYYLGRPVRTFGVDPEAPPVDSFVIVSEERSALIDPAVASRLELQKRVEHPWQPFHLYRVLPQVAAGGT